MSTCHRHVEKKAKRKCYECRRIICVDCYYRRDAHIFCSRGCHLKWMAKESRSGLRKRLHREVPVPMFAAVVIFALLPLGIVLGRVTDELDRGILPGGERVRKEAPLSAAIETMEEREKSLVIEGRTAGGAVAFLLRDGAPAGSANADPDGVFRFEVPIPEAATTWAVAAVRSSEIAAAAFSPRPRPLAPPPGSIRSGVTRFVESFTRGPATRPEVVLSFDAGSSATGAEAVLDELRARGIRTTIFLTGEFIARYPAIVRRVVADGHEVGNHTWSHPHLTTFSRNRKQLTLPSMTKETLQAELRRTADAFREVAGTSMAPYWRAPFGEENSEIRAWASELGYLHVGWTRGRRYNLDSLDWVSDRRSSIYYDPEQLADRLIGFGEANGTTLHGGIVLMHLGSDREEDERLDKALPRLIAGLEARGMRFVTVSEMRRAADEVAVTAANQPAGPMARGGSE